MLNAAAEEKLLRAIWSHLQIKLPLTTIPAICSRNNLLHPSDPTLHILKTCLNSAKHAPPGSVGAPRWRQRQRKPPQPPRLRPRRERGTILRQFRSTARRTWPRGGSAIHRKVHSLTTEHAINLSLKTLLLLTFLPSVTFYTLLPQA